MHHEIYLVKTNSFFFLCPSSWFPVTIDQETMNISVTLNQAFIEVDENDWEHGEVQELSCKNALFAALFAAFFAALFAGFLAELVADLFPELFTELYVSIDVFF